VLASLALAACSVYDSSLLAHEDARVGPSAGSAGMSEAGALNEGGSPEGGSTGEPSGRGGDASSGASGATSASGGHGGVGGMVGGGANGGSTTGAAATGGTAAAGSGSGGIGGAGAGGSAGAGGIGGGGVGGGGVVEHCSGCAKLSVPLSATTDHVHFAILLPSATDLTNATVTLRLALEAGAGGTISMYVQQGGPNYGWRFSNPIRLGMLSPTMQTVVWNVKDSTGTPDATGIERIGIQVDGAGGSPYTSPSVILVDSIVVTGSSLASGSFTFDTSSSVYTTKTSSGPVGTIWLNNYAGDTNVAGATISWVGP